jgi:hypothetical protein
VCQGSLRHEGREWSANNEADILGKSARPQVAPGMAARNSIGRSQIPHRPRSRSAVRITFKQSIWNSTDNGLSLGSSAELRCFGAAAVAFLFLLRRCNMCRSLVSVVCSLFVVSVLVHVVADDASAQRWRGGRAGGGCCSPCCPAPRLSGCCPSYYGYGGEMLAAPQDAAPCCPGALYGIRGYVYPCRRDTCEEYCRNAYGNNRCCRTVCEYECNMNCTIPDCSPNAFGCTYTTCNGQTCSCGPLGQACVCTEGRTTPMRTPSCRRGPFCRPCR